MATATIRLLAVGIHLIIVVSLAIAISGGDDCKRLRLRFVEYLGNCLSGTGGTGNMVIRSLIIIAETLFGTRVGRLIVAPSLFCAV